MLRRRAVRPWRRCAGFTVVTAIRRIHLLVPVLVLPGAPALAHAFLQRASPPVGSELPVSPPAVTITYTEGVEPDFSTIEDALAGSQALADQNGWLRLRWRPGDSPSWNDQNVLDAAMRDISQHPLAVAAGGGHAHHH
jgi:hypothetical protein